MSTRGRRGRGVGVREGEGGREGRGGWEGGEGRVIKKELLRRLKGGKEKREVKQQKKKSKGMHERKMRRKR